MPDNGILLCIARGSTRLRKIMYEQTTLSKQKFVAYWADMHSGGLLVKLISQDCKDKAPGILICRLRRCYTETKNRNDNDNADGDAPWTCNRQQQKGGASLQSVALSVEQSSKLPNW